MAKKVTKKPDAMVRQKDARILREAVAWCFKKTPPMIQKKMSQVLLEYAAAVKLYCTCTERAHVANEKKYACLDCGQRHATATSKNPVLEIVK